MDPIENMKEQISLAQSIQSLEDQCSGEGEFNVDQRIEVMHRAFRLAELVIALNEWNIRKIQERR